MVTTQKSPPAKPSLGDSDCLVLTLPSNWKITDEAFAALISLNEELRFEVDDAGRLIIMGSGAWVSSADGYEIGAQVKVWADTGGGGRVSGEGGYVEIAGVGRRAPDVAWVSQERVARMSPTRQGPGRVVPDLIVEIRSPTDRLRDLQEKMTMWIAAGARLAWLVDPERTTAHIYRPAARSPPQAPVPQRRGHRPRPHRRPHPNLAARVAVRSVRVRVCWAASRYPIARWARTLQRSRLTLSRSI